MRVTTVRDRDVATLAPLLSLLLLVSACATPIGVAREGTQEIYRSLTSSVLSTGKPSAASEQVLRRRGLEDRFEKEPEVVLAELRGSGESLSRDRLFVLAELSFYHAQKAGKREYYLGAAVYAYAFLTESDWNASAAAVDPRTRLSANLYNLGLALGLAARRGADAVDAAAPARPEPEVDEIILTDRTLPLPFGTLELRTDPEQFRWGEYRMSRFIAVGEYRIRGLRNHYRQAGVGAPLAAEVTPVGTGPEAAAARTRIPPRIKVPVTAFVRIEGVQEAIARGHVQGRVEIYPADAATTLEVQGHTLPLEQEPSATLAFLLEGAPVWDTEIAGFLAAYRPVFPGGLIMMHPYRPGRVPVVLIHGTASSPARWADMVNELQNDPALRERVQFWLFTYNTSNPILLSASELRRALAEVVRQIDPGGRDPALRRMVLIGHSQGGLLARLMVTSSGDRFWENVTTKPFEEVTMTPETRDMVRPAMFFEPAPDVTRVIFIATPHRGSFRVTGFVLDLVRRLVTLPVTVVRVTQDLIRQNPDLLSAHVKNLPTAVDNMSPGHPFIRALSSRPIADGVHVHSIVAVEGTGPISGRTDGVVRYDSAHLDMGTEKIVRSSHSVQGQPEAILEVQRILREHVTEP